MAAGKDHDMSDAMSSDNEMSDYAYSDDEKPKHSAHAIYEKDSEEEELERLVLGDENIFRNNLFKGGDYTGAYDAAGKELTTVDEEDDGLEGVSDAALFMFDTGASGAAPKGTKAATQQSTEELPAWEDSDDDRITVSLAGASRLRKLRETEADDIVSGREYSRRLRQQFLRLNPVPGWAKTAEEQQQQQQRPSKRSKKNEGDDTSDSDADSDAELSALPMSKFLRSVNKLGSRDSGVSRALQPGTIDIQRTRDIADRHNKPVLSISFHPKYPVVLSSSAASVMWVHHIAPEAQPPNPALTSVKAQQVDVRRAEFLYPEGDKVFFAGRRRYFHHWDLPTGAVQKTTRVNGRKGDHKSMERFRLSPCGRYMGIQGSGKKGSGIISILSTSTMQWIAEARLSSTGGVEDFVWWRNGEGMTILGHDGTVGEYSVAERVFLATWIDEGGTNAVVIALGGADGPAEFGEDSWVAIGSNSGILTLYNRSFLTEETVKERPTPTRTFENLLTRVTSVSFSPDGQLLVYASKEKDNALKLIHVGSQTVYKNWPTQQTPLGTVTALAFGRKSDMLAVGNDKGLIRLWDIMR